MCQGIFIFYGHTERIANVNACKDIGLASNTEETKYMEVRRCRSMMTNVHITVGIRYFHFLWTHIGTRM